ncbi:MAG: hypothetical protein O3A23_03100 [Proteobacteria bacterium]|nr:hypothetical protein [Pseudomonadota bacterium]
MSDNSNNAEQKCPEAIIAGVDASDLIRARTAVASGVQLAQKEWIPSHLIVCALSLELQGQLVDAEASNDLAIYLRRLADFFSTEAPTTDRH